MIAASSLGGCATQPLPVSSPTQNPVFAYHQICYDVMEAPWHRETQKHDDLLGLGSAVVSFNIPNTGGHATDIKVLAQQGPEIISEIAVKVAEETVFPAMPPDVVGVLGGKPYHFEGTFTVVSGPVIPSVQEDMPKLKGFVYNPRPPYPPEARRHRWTGNGIFELHFNSNGTVSKVVVIRSTGHRLLDDTCKETLAEWRCRSGVYTKVKLPVNFTLDRPKIQ